MDRLKKESGQALLLVMMVVMVLVLIGAAALTRTSGSRLRSFEQKKMVQSSYIAEAGIEKVLANIKNDYKWLKDLPLNQTTDYKFVGESTYLDYAGGRISNVKVKRTSTVENISSFYIESQGDFQGATRTIKVTGEMYDPIDFARGVWFRSTSVFSNNAIFNTDITSEGELTFQNNAYANGTIRAVGDVNLENNTTSQTVIDSVGIITGGNLNVAQNVKIRTNVEVAQNLSMGQNATITGSANVRGNITLTNNAVISGDVYYNGTLTNPLPSGASTGTTYPGQAKTVTVSVPSFPVQEESLYEQYPNLAPTGTLSGNFNLDGIYYIPGDLNIQGTYTGKGMIVTKGKVTITGDLLRYDNNRLDSIKPTHSLAIIAFGQDASGIGIESRSNKVSIEALLFTPNKIVLNNSNAFYGSLICNQVEVDQNGKVTYDESLYTNHPKWLTTVVKIKSWKESNPVF